MTKFTKGPWTWEVDDRGYTVGLFSETAGIDVIELNKTEFGHPFEDRLEFDFFNKSDSSLIAAAPDLYEALEETTNLIGCEEGNCCDCYKVVFAKCTHDLKSQYIDNMEVLKKARGES